MKKFENLGRSLSKQEQKRIMGGTEGQAPCSVTCNTGYYACCYSNNGYQCNCVKNGDQPPQTCTADGSNSSQCSIGGGES